MRPSRCGEVTLNFLKPSHGIPNILFCLDILTSEAAADQYTHEFLVAIMLNIWLYFGFILPYKLKSRKYFQYT